MARDVFDAIGDLPIGDIFNAKRRLVLNSPIGTAVLFAFLEKHGNPAKRAIIAPNQYQAQKIYESLLSFLPEEKVNAIEKLQSENHKVCMIGDGVNDAPALKRADVSVAMGNMGSDIAIDAADVALISDDISKIPYLKWLSNEAIKTIKISITLSMTINFIAIVLSLMEVLTPTTGALVHNAGSCFVVLIAALLYDKKYKG